jgi:Uma2 family endonuclease
MVAEPHGRRWSVDEYLWLERNSLVKHEFVDGIVYALAGGTRAHSRIAMNAGRLLEEALDASACRVFNSDMKVRISPRVFRYPDLSVSCDTRDDNADDEELDYIGFPTLILETLSDSTAHEDRAEKFAEYRTIPTFREYMLAAADRIAVQVYRRGVDGAWAESTHAAGDELVLESLGVRLPVAALYRKVRLRPRAAPSP